MWFIGPIRTRITLSRFSGYFALCYSAGLDIITALRTGEDIVRNSVIRDGIRRIGAEIGNGLSLSDSIEAYRRGETPLVVPVTLLRHYFRRHPDPYMAQQIYLRPHPDKLGLRNHI